MQRDRSQYSRNYIGQIVKVTIDRPLGTKHPRYDLVYAVNYGFVPHTLAPDGEEIDVYVLGVLEPIESFEGRCIAVIHRMDDDDDKLVVVSDGCSYSDEQIQSLTNFQERFFDSEIIRS